MSLRVIILTASKQAIIKRINPKSSHYRYKGGLYVLSADAIANYEFNGDIKGSEVVFFEGNPNPLTDTGITDKSKHFMDDEVLVNALKQTSKAPRVDLGGLSDILDGVKGYFSVPGNIIWFLFYAVIAYAIIGQLMSGGLGA